MVSCQELPTDGTTDKPSSSNAQYTNSSGEGGSASDVSLSNTGFSGLEELGIANLLLHNLNVEECWSDEYRSHGKERLGIDRQTYNRKSKHCL
ncbi:hypothetical protein Pcinc_025125 [Petrolisthes cinctipes]|uniref:Uncharacterized protein n=1 Tax=Petrolisthes cinctipes TaxID=88211 RepID=A0AAE1KCF5_PETCI|nr:hypothetical protein Pcinc_025125 [Petrolisthes cinctipes]